MSKISEWIIDFERDENPFSLKVKEVYIWERIRHKVRAVINKKTKNKTSAYEKDWSLWGLSKTLYRYACNTVSLKNWHPPPSRLFFVGHQRRKIEEDGKWWDIYCDPIHDVCDISYVHYEFPYRTAHKSPAKTRELRKLDSINLMKNIPFVGRFSLNKEEKKVISDWNSKINKAFNIRLNLKKMIQESLKERISGIKVYNYLIDKVEPDAFILTVSYGKETLIEVCKSRNIPVVELQHGYIDSTHLGYSFPSNRRKEMFPDYLLTFGEHWHDGINFPIPDSRLIPVGFPYLDSKLSKYSKKSEREDNIIFISQPTIGEELSKLASKVANSTQESKSVVYKLHPHEYENWRERYPWLIKSKCTVVDNDMPHLYDLFARSNFQVGVNSTALYEGLAFGLTTLLYGDSDTKIADDLKEIGRAQVVYGCDDVLSAIDSYTEPFSYPVERVFRSGSQERMCNILHEIASKGTTYKACT